MIMSLLQDFFKIMVGWTEKSFGLYSREMGELENNIYNCE